MFHSQPKTLYLNTYNAWVEHQRHYVADDNKEKQRKLFEKDDPDFDDGRDMILPELICPDVLVESGREVSLEITTRDPLGWCSKSFSAVVRFRLILSTV